jgi:hypothetical protein
VHVRYEFLLHCFEIWTTSPLGGFLAHVICKIEKQKKHLTLILNGKLAKQPRKKPTLDI